jgi:hypothetical protein
MCSGQANALPNTHATITATLIVQSSMPSIVLVAPNPTTTQSSNWSNSMSLKSTRTQASSTSGFLTSTGSTTKSTPAASTYSAMASSMSPVPSPMPTLTKPQIIGITVASIGGGTVALGCLILFACWRRRQYRKARESDLLPFQMDPSTSSSTQKFVGFKGPTERGGPWKPGRVAGRSPPRVPPRLEISSPNMFSRRSIKPDTIGLALSPETKVNQQGPQRLSRLLPEKPTLTLMMPPKRERPQPGNLSFSQPVTLPSAVSRQSTATQFEEDFESADTAVARDDTWRSNSGEQIWDYTRGQWTTIRPVEANIQPQSASLSTTGEESQWRPGQASNLTMSPISYVKPLTLGSKVGSFSQPRRPDAYQRPQQQQPQQQLVIPTQNGRPITTTSSIYSQRGSLPASEVARHSSNRARRSYKQAGPYDHNSVGSLTSFDTEESIVSPIEQEPKTADLSPVVESPASGRSPVSYPKIPGRLSASTIRMVPPPPQPDFSKALSAQAGANKPWRQAEIAAQRERERAQAQNQVQEQVGMQPFEPGSGIATHQRKRSRDNTSGFPSPPAKAAARSLAQPLPTYQKQPPPQNYYLPRIQTTQLQSKIPPPPPNPPMTDATGGLGYPQPTAQPTSSHALNPLTSHPSITFTRSSSSVSQYSTNSKISTSSSLLAKRRGEQKAHALTLKNEEERKRGGKWRVLGREEIEEAKKEGWRPMLGSGKGEDKDEYEARTGQQFERTELPNTPGWVPKLTPTRRGDELFLSVQ